MLKSLFESVLWLILNLNVLRDGNGEKNRQMWSLQDTQNVNCQLDFQKKKQKHFWLKYHTENRTKTKTVVAEHILGLQDFFFETQHMILLQILSIKQVLAILTHLRMAFLNSNLLHFWNH